MKRTAKTLLLMILRVLRGIFSPESMDRLRSANDKLYSLWMSIGFKECSTLSLSRPAYIKGARHISLGKNFSAGPRFRIEAWDKYGEESYSPEITIEENVSFSSNCHVGAINRIMIRKNVLIGSNVLITDHSHGEATKEATGTPPTKRRLFSKGPVVIEENVWIGENVSILPGVVIGHDSIVGANSVVTKTIPPNVVAAGNPATVVKRLL